MVQRKNAEGGSLHGRLASVKKAGIPAMTARQAPLHDRPKIRDYSSIDAKRHMLSLHGGIADVMLLVNVSAGGTHGSLVRDGG